jgi:hypothetical protein
VLYFPIWRTVPTSPSVLLNLPALSSIKSPLWGCLQFWSVLVVCVFESLPHITVFYAFVLSTFQPAAQCHSPFAVHRAGAFLDGRRRISTHEIPFMLWPLGQSDTLSLPDYEYSSDIVVAYRILESVKPLRSTVTGQSSHDVEKWH